MNNSWIGTLAKGRKASARVRNRVTVLLSSVTLCLLCLSTPALAITQNLSWVGWNGYSMTGTFSFDDVLIGTGEIDATDLDTLMIEGFRYGASLGTWDLAAGQGGGATAFQFGFNTTTNTFLQGGASGEAQFWNHEGNPGLGFFNDDSFQGLTFDGVELVESFLDKSVDTPTLFVGDLPTTSSFNLSWIGANGYSMTGMFSYWDIFDDGLIEGQHLNSLMIEGFLNGVSIGAWDLTDGQGAGASLFQFGFNTTTNTFLQGGSSGEAQFWNHEGNPGLGFFSGEDSQHLTLDGIEINESEIIGKTLSATPKNGTEPIPEPSTMLLLGTGLVGLVVWRWKTRKQT